MSRFLCTIFSFLFAFHSLDAFTSTPQKAAPRVLLITGCGRSGTEFISKFLKESGFDIPHEAFGMDGCVSWPMTVNFYSPWGPVSDQNYQHCFHQVRDPLAVITSWLINLNNTDSDEWKFVRDHVSEIKPEDSLLIQCAKYWYYWNLLAEAKAEWRYRIEDIKKILPEFEKRLNITLSSKVLDQIPTNTNSWKDTSKKITWDDLKNGLPEDLYENLRKMAIRYGYLE